MDKTNSAFLGKGSSSTRRLLSGTTTSWKSRKPWKQNWPFWGGKWWPEHIFTCRLDASERMFWKNESYKAITETFSDKKGDIYTQKVCKDCIGVFIYILFTSPKKAWCLNQNRRSSASGNFNMNFSTRVSTGYFFLKTISIMYQENLLLSI